MRQHRARVIVRGLRAISDFEYEFQMALMNRNLYPQVETVFLMTDEHYSYLSSSIVKELAGFNADIRSFVPRSVVPYLNKHRTAIAKKRRKH
jgi:pantetheine-phosphate adenylyltransferase